MGNNKVQRNDPCPCRSGLKFKKCHGDSNLINMATSAAKIVATLNIARRACDAGIATEAQYTAGTLEMIAVLNKMLPGGITVTLEDYVEPEPERDKLADKAESGSALKELQEGMEPCPRCGRRLPVGMKCTKCTGDQL